MIKTMLIPTDGSDHAKKAVTLGSDMAARYNARLILVHSLMTGASSEELNRLATRSKLNKSQQNLLDNYEKDFQLEVAAAGASTGFTHAPPPRELTEAIGLQLLDRAESAAAKAGVKDVSSFLVNGDPAKAILEIAENHNVNMIVMGSRGLSDFKGLILGSISHKVSAHCNCTCVTVK